MTLRRWMGFKRFSLACALWTALLGLQPAWALAAGDKHDAKAGDSSGAPPLNWQEEYPPYLIGPGDMLSITVYGEKDLPINYLVDSNGTIVFPLVGEVKVAGYTQGQASTELARKLGSYLKAPQVTVLIEETNSYTVSVLGQVTRPGKFRIRGIPTLLNVLAEAGGPVENASLSGAVLIRGNKKAALDLNRFLTDLGNREPQPLLYPGDVILVPRSPWPTLGEWAIIMSLLTGAALLAATVESNRTR